MQLDLKNIGMIKEASVKIDGLTVIAGENDTGKSTVGKALFSILECSFEHTFNVSNFLKNIFQEKNILKNGSINLITDKKTEFFLSMDEKGTINSGAKNLEDFPERGIFIETPILWNMQDFFNVIVQVESRLKTRGDVIDIPYPYLMKDLHYKLQTRRVKEEKLIISENKIEGIINGKFIKTKNTNEYRFVKGKENYPLINVATGIKYFGLIQVLIDNYQIDKKSILILDEPEVHLHPKWQLEMAKIIVELVKNGVKIVVNSHSPYMIEALELYAEKANITRNFYLAKKEDEFSVISDVSDNLELIYAQLAEAINILEEESLDNFKW